MDVALQGIWVKMRMSKAKEGIREVATERPKGRENERPEEEREDG